MGDFEIRSTIHDSTLLLFVFLHACHGGLYMCVLCICCLFRFVFGSHIISASGLISHDLVSPRPRLYTSLVTANTGTVTHQSNRSRNPSVDSDLYLIALIDHNLYVSNNEDDPAIVNPVCVLRHESLSLSLSSICQSFNHRYSIGNVKNLVLRGQSVLVPFYIKLHALCLSSYAENILRNGCNLLFV